MGSSIKPPAITRGEPPSLRFDKPPGLQGGLESLKNIMKWMKFVFGSSQQLSPHLTASNQCLSQSFRVSSQTHRAAVSYSLRAKKVNLFSRTLKEQKVSDLKLASPRGISGSKTGSVHISLNNSPAPSLKPTGNSLKSYTRVWRCSSITEWPWSKVQCWSLRLLDQPF